MYDNCLFFLTFIAELQPIFIYAQYTANDTATATATTTTDTKLRAALPPIRVLEKISLSSSANVAGVRVLDG